MRVLKVDFYQNIFLSKLDFYWMFTKTETKIIKPIFFYQNQFYFQFKFLYLRLIFQGLS
jgi:hypothetical protein